MEVSMSLLLQAVFHSILFGMFLAFCYDAMGWLAALLHWRRASYGRWELHMLPLLRRYLLPPQKKQSARHRKGGRFVADLSFFLFAGIAECVFLYAENSGILRAYFLIGACIGFFVYRNTVTKLCSRILTPVIAWMQIVVIYACFVVFLPILSTFYMFFFIFFLILMNFILIVWNLCGIIKMKNIQNGYERSILRDASHGFLNGRQKGGSQNGAELLR